MIYLTKQTKKLSFGGINSLFPPGGIPSPTRLVSPHTRTRRALNECGSMLFKACFHTCSSGALFINSLIGPNVLTGAICRKSVVHRLHNLPPWPPGALCQRRVATIPNKEIHKQHVGVYLAVPDEPMRVRITEVKGRRLHHQRNIGNFNTSKDFLFCVL